MLKRSMLSALSLRVSMCLLATTVTLPALGEEGPEADRDHPAERAEWNAMLRRDRNGRVLSENRLKALDAMCQIPVDPSMAQAPAGSFTRSAVGPSVRSSYTFSGTSWQSLGPQPMQSYTGIPQRQYGNVGGRVDAIAIKPSDPNTILVGSATGGIWKSTDAGSTWHPVSEFAPSLSISSIAFAASNPSVVYAGTGEADAAFASNARLGIYYGSGLLKSVDGGDTWARIDVNLPVNAIISRVVVQRTNEQNVLVGVYAGSPATRGVYRSTDGGVHFTRTFSDNNVSDLVSDPNDPSRIYLGAGTSYAASVCSNCVIWGVLGSLDFGATWLTTTLSTSSQLGPVRLGASRTNPTVLYASILDATDNSYSGLGGIFVSTDAGVNWRQVATETSMCPTKASGENNQCWYDHVIAPDPLNPSTVYFGSISVYRSLDSGASWSKYDVYPTQYVATIHPDQHAVAFSPAGAIYVGNDGGVYKTTDGGASFQNLNATLNMSQFQSLALHPTNTAFAMGGTQDNGNQLYTGSVVWRDRTGGDGGFGLIRQDTPSQLLVANYYAYMHFSSDSGNTFAYATSPLLMDSSGNPTEKMAFFPPAVAPPNAPSTVFFGTNRVWQNDTFGANATSWQHLTAGSILSSADDFITTIAAATDGSGPLWVGSAFGEVRFAAANSSTFSLRSAGLPSAPVTHIASVSADGRSAYATFAGYLGLPSKHLFRTTDAGVTWTNISNNLPDVPVLDIKVDPTDPTDIFLGSDVGVFRSTNGGATWTTFNAGLPNVPVYQLAFHPVTNDLWAATYGRGVWRVTNPASVLAANFSFSPPIPSTGQVVTFTDRSTGSPTSWSWNFGDGSGGSPAQNPSHSFFGAGIYQVGLTVANSGGSNTMTQAVVVNRGAAAGCIADAYTMCFGNGRYRVTSSWQNQYVGDKIPTSLRKTAFTDIVGTFWIDAGAYQYFVSVNPATSALNGYTWVAINTFSGVEFWIDVTDTVSGLHKTYHNPPENKTLVEDRTFFAYP